MTSSYQSLNILGSGNVASPTIIDCIVSPSTIVQYNLPMAHLITPDEFLLWQKQAEFDNTTFTPIDSDVFPTEKVFISLVFTFIYIARVASHLNMINSYSMGKPFTSVSLLITAIFSIIDPTSILLVLPWIFIYNGIISYAIQISVLMYLKTYMCITETVPFYVTYLTIGYYTKYVLINKLRNTRPESDSESDSDNDVSDVSNVWVGRLRYKNTEYI
jgi:hypothetical protein